SPGHFTLTLHNSSSPFESVLEVDLDTLAPTFERDGLPSAANRSLIAAHQDFHGLVNFSDPAAPAETLHFYITGLGDVQPRPPTGQPPSSLAYANQRTTCSLTSALATQQNARVEFAGIAPGLVGIYQLDITIPASYPTSVATLVCFGLGGSQAVSGDFG